MALVGKNSEKNNQNLMQLIRRVHGLVENPDLEKHETIPGSYWRAVGEQ